MRKKRLFSMAFGFVLLLGLTPIMPAASATTFELLAPVSTVFQYPTDYKLFTGDGITDFPSASGDVTAPVQFVSYGNTAAYYAGFSPGNIALIERGGTGDTYFSTKVNLAEASGAVGAIIFDNTNNYQPVTHDVQTFIPSIFTTDDIGAQLLSYTYTGALLIAHISIDPISTPEPTSLLLLGLGLMGLAGVGRKLKK